MTPSTAFVCSCLIINDRSSESPEETLSSWKLGLNAHFIPQMSSFPQVLALFFIKVVLHLHTSWKFNIVVSNRGNSYVCLQMVRGKEITPEVRAQVDILRQTGLKYRDIAQKLKISVAAAYKTVKRIEELQSFASRKRSGRRKVTTERDDRLISRIVKNSPKASSLSVKVRLPKTLCNVSTRTIRRRLFDNGLKSYTPARKPKLSAKNINDRLLFCKKYQNWTKRE